MTDNQITGYKVQGPLCGGSIKTDKMQDAHDWGRQHRYHNHKGMQALDMPVVTIGA